MEKNSSALQRLRTVFAQFLAEFEALPRSEQLRLIADVVAPVSNGIFLSRGMVAVAQCATELASARPTGHGEIKTNSAYERFYAKFLQAWMDTSSTKCD